MPKVIEFDPIACLKTLPAEFWLQVPTYDQKYCCEILKDFERVDAGKDNFGRDRGTKRQDKRPDACKQFPQYAEFFDKYENAHKDYMLERSYRIEKWEKSLEENAQHDWVEWTIGEFSFRIHGERGRVIERMFFHPSLGKWHRINNDWELKKEHPKLYKKLQSATKRVSATWNRLRKEARRTAGLDLSAKDAAKAKAEEKSKKIKEETKLCADHIDFMIQALQEHKQKVLSGKITRNETGYIFDLTNEMTARNAALRDALGNS